MKKLITPLLVAAALVGGMLSARLLDAQVIWSPRQGIHFTGTVDPSAGLGLVAAEGTIYVRTGATDGLYVKTGSTNTAWTSIALSGGAASFSSVTASGNIVGAIVRGTTALEYPDSAAGPGVRCATDTDTGFGHNGANANSIWSNGIEQVFVTTTQTFVNSSETVINQELETRDIRIRLPQTVDIDAAGDTFSVVAGNRPVQEFTLSAGNISLTSTPTLANGANGQEMTLCNVDATDTLTLNDQDSVANTNLQLSAATVVLGPRDCITLRYSSAWGDWVQVAFLNVA